MIQDIAPSRLNNRWQPQQPARDSFVMCFREGKLLAAISDGVPQFPRYQGERDVVYLFSVDDETFYLADIAKIPAGYQFYTLRDMIALPILHRQGFFIIILHKPVLGRSCRGHKESLRSHRSCNPFRAGSGYPRDLPRSIR